MNKTTIIYIILAFALTSATCFGPLNPRNRKLQTCQEGEISCWDGNTHSTFCHVGTLCPARCSDQEMLCTGHYDETLQAHHEWCNPIGTPCPLTCQAGEMNCWNENHEEYCHVGNICPIFCMEGEHKCFGQMDTLTNYQSEWCQHESTPCPVYCMAHETICFNEQGEQFCHPGTTCPLQCSLNQVKCTGGYDEVLGYNSEWCQPIGTTCPLQCPAGEQVCWNEHHEEFCHSGTSCPVICLTGEKKCHTPADATVPGSESYDYCISEFDRCPVYCQALEIECIDDNNKSYCHFGTVCPVPNQHLSCADFNLNENAAMKFTYDNQNFLVLTENYIEACYSEQTRVRDNASHTEIMMDQSNLPPNGHYDEYSRYVINENGFINDQHELDVSFNSKMDFLDNEMNMNSNMSWYKKEYLRRVLDQVSYSAFIMTRDFSQNVNSRVINLMYRIQSNDFADLDSQLDQMTKEVLNGVKNSLLYH